MRRQGRRGAGWNALQRGGMATLVPLQKFRAYGLAAAFLPSMATKNVNDVATLPDLSGATLNVSLAQATPSKQPLINGAPTYGGQPSIAGTHANGDMLLVTSKNPIGATGDITVISVQRWRDLGPNYYTFMFGASFPNGPVVALGTGLRMWYPGGCSWGAPSTTLAEVWHLRCPRAGTPTLWVNNALQARTGGGGAVADPGGTSTVGIGSVWAGPMGNIDYCFHALFVGTLPPDAVASRMNRGMLAKFAVAQA